MIEILAVVVPVIVTGVGGYTHLWVKNNVNEANIASLRELINTRFDDKEKSDAERHEETDRRLDRIERSMNGHLLKD